MAIFSKYMGDPEASGGGNVFYPDDPEASGGGGFDRPFADNANAIANFLARGGKYRLGPGGLLYNDAGAPVGDSSAQGPAPYGAGQGGGPPGGLTGPVPMPREWLPPGPQTTRQIATFGPFSLRSMPF